MIHPLFDQHQYKEIDASGEKRHQPTGPQHGVPFDTGAGIVHQNLDKIEKQAEDHGCNPADGIPVDDKQAEDTGKVFDMLISSGIYKEFLENMNKEEIIKPDDSKNDALLENKIYIRKFRSGVYRITIGKKEENDKLLEVLK